MSLLNILKKQSEEKVVVIGLDGVPYTLLKRFINSGAMPNLTQIVGEGTLLQMDSSLPEVSSVAWTTFFTGVNPAIHGIYGFMDLRPRTYEVYFPNTLDIKSDAIWDTFGKVGKRSVIINIPHTYPARTINGVLISGFVAIDIKKASYPDSAYEYLNGMGYRIDVDTQKAGESLDYLVEDIKLTFDKRKEAILHFFDKEPWDLFISVISETDRLHHFMWDALDNVNHQYHNFFMEFYKDIDQFLGCIYDRCSKFNPKPKFLMLSDHGFTGIEKEIYLNYWLKENGYLVLSKESTKTVEDIADSTKAFALDPSRIYINLKDKYPKGCISPGREYDDLREELTKRLLETGVIKSVFKKEEIYSGPLFAHAPDLVLLSKEGYDLKGSVAKDVFMAKGKLNGMHTHHDAMFFVNEHVERNKKLKISDVAQFIFS